MTEDQGAMATRLFGRSVERVEDPAVLRARVRYLDDIEVEDPLYLAFVRCPMAHARVGPVNGGAALDTPGVMAVLTAADLGEANGPFPHPTWLPPADALREAVDPLVRPEYLTLLADERARYTGQAVAVVVAENPAVAADAAGLVEVDYEPLPVVPDVDAALGKDAPLVNPEWGDNIAAHFTVRKEDVDQAMAEADVVVGRTFRLARQAGSPIEPRGVLASPDQAPHAVAVWSSTQSPHWLRNALSERTGLPRDRIRVVAPSVGGGFGTKSMVYPEELTVPLVALLLGRAVKWVETRSEHFLAAVQSRDQRHEVELGLTADGHILGLRDRYVVDVGASNVEALVVPYNTAAHLQGPYRVPAVSIECTCVVTNKAPLSAYRGAGRPEAVFAMERALDLAARELDLDPAELRRRNLLAADAMPADVGIPYRDGNRLELDAGDPMGCFEAALRAFDYAAWRSRQSALREEGRFVGIGMAGYIEGTGIGPAEVAEARLEPSGHVRIAVALPSQGQAHATTLAQLSADELGVALEDVTLVQGDTAAVSEGGATIASRVAVVAGNAVVDASQRLRARVLDLASEVLEAAADDLELRDGLVAVRGSPGTTVSLGEIAAAAGSDHNLTVRGEFAPPRVTFASGVHVTAVEVDPWTGQVEVLRYVVAHDCGRLINPAVVEGQIVGGVVQGIGSALFERMVYDESGQLVTGSFIDYLLPRATDVPNVEVHHLETPSTFNPLGIKGVGEAGIIGPPAAVVGAVEDALAPFGVHLDHCPLLPGDIAEGVPTDRLPRPVKRLHAMPETD